MAHERTHRLQLSAGFAACSQSRFDSPYIYAYNLTIRLIRLSSDDVQTDCLVGFKRSRHWECRLRCLLSPSCVDAQEMSVSLLRRTQYIFFAVCSISSLPDAVYLLCRMQYIFSEKLVVLLLQPLYSTDWGRVLSVQDDTRKPPQRLGCGGLAECISVSGVSRPI